MLAPKIIIFLMTLTWASTARAAAARPEIKLCYVSSPINGVLPRAQSITTASVGFRLALQEYEQTSGRGARLVEFEPRRAAMAIPDGIKWAKEQGCLAVVGLVSSKDALVAGPFLAERDLVGVSSTATSDELDKFFPYLMSTSTAASSPIAAITRLVKNDRRRAVVLYDGTDFFSNFYYKELKEQLPLAKFLTVDGKGQLAPNALADLKRADGGTIFVVTLYPFKSLPALEQLAGLGLAAPQRSLIIGNPAWMEVQSFANRRDIFGRLPPAKVFSPWDTRKVTAPWRAFRANLKREFGAEPDHDSVYDYDVTRWILSCVDKAKASTSADLRSCLSRSQTFEGLTGRYRFGGHSSHPEREETLLTLMLEGMIPQ